MNSQQINYFLAICENRSFSKTAAQFYVSQPTVSTQISALERELGIVLLERTRNYVSLTPAGNAYAEFFLQSRDQIDQLSRTYGGQRDKAAFLVVGLLHACQPPELTARFTRFRQEHPSVGLRLRSMNPTQTGMPLNLLARHMDVLITLHSAVFDNPAVCWAPIMNTRFVFLASATDSHVDPSHCCVEQFCDQTLLVPNVNTDPGYQQILHRFKKNYNLQYMHTEVIPSLEAICLSVSCGLGVSILNEYTVLHYPGLITLDINESQELVAVWHKDNKNPNLKTFLTCLSHEDV